MMIGRAWPGTSLQPDGAGALPAGCRQRGSSPKNFDVDINVYTELAIAEGKRRRESHYIHVDIIVLWEYTPNHRDLMAIAMTVSPLTPEIPHHELP